MLPSTAMLLALSGEQAPRGFFNVAVCESCLKPSTKTYRGRRQRGAPKPEALFCHTCHSRPPPPPALRSDAALLTESQQFLLLPSVTAGSMMTITLGMVVDGRLVMEKVAVKVLRVVDGEMKVSISDHELTLPCIGPMASCLGWDYGPDVVLPPPISIHQHEVIVRRAKCVKAAPLPLPPPAAAEPLQPLEVHDEEPSVHHMVPPEVDNDIVTTTTFDVETARIMAGDAMTRAQVLRAIRHHTPGEAVFVQWANDEDAATTEVALNYKDSVGNWVVTYLDGRYGQTVEMLPPRQSSGVKVVAIFDDDPVEDRATYEAFRANLREQDLRDAVPLASLPPSTTHRTEEREMERALLLSWEESANEDHGIHTGPRTCTEKETQEVADWVCQKIAVRDPSNIKRLLECAVCLSPYNESVCRPLMLGCGHTICEGCFAKYSEVCPECRLPVNKKVNPPRVCTLLLSFVSELTKADDTQEEKPMPQEEKKSAEKRSREDRDRDGVGKR